MATRRGFLATLGKLVGGVGALYVAGKRYEGERPISFEGAETDTYYIHIDSAEYPGDIRAHYRIEPEHDYRGLVVD